MTKSETIPHATFSLAQGLDGIHVDMPNGGRSLLLDPARSLKVRLAGLPTAWLGDYVVRVCTFGPDGRPDPARLRRLHDLGWSGRCNHIVRFDMANGWVVEHAGHTLPFLVNGEDVHDEMRPLRDGDLIEPARGLVFRFSSSRP